MPAYSITDPLTKVNMTVEKDGDEPLSQDEIDQVISEHRKRRGVSQPSENPITAFANYASRSPMVQDIGDVVKRDVMPAVRTARDIATLPSRLGARALGAVGDTVGGYVGDALKGYGMAYNRFVKPEVENVVGAAKLIKGYVLPPPDTGTQQPAISASRIYLDAPADKTQRKIGEIYQTPKGPMKWVGNGWQTP